MLGKLAPGDLVTVTRIDRLPRSTFDLFGIVKRIVDAGAQFRSLAEPWAERHRPVLNLYPSVLHCGAGGFVMSANSIVRARIDEKIKNEAADVLRAMGLTVSDAFRMMMVKIAKEKALPFEPLVPNEETIEAMKAARRGELVTVGPPGKLLASLNADC